MQSIHSESSSELSFTYCLFLDDHFPSVNESEFPLSKNTSTKHMYTKMENSLTEILTQVSTKSEESKDIKKKKTFLTSVRTGFLSTDESNSESESFELNYNEKIEKNLNHNNYKEKLHNVDISKQEENINQTKSLENLEIKQEKKNGFSIWSCITPGLGLEENMKSSNLENEVIISVDKLSLIHI